jgi:hypothetical protein
MANISQTMQKSMLDWALNGASPARPAAPNAGLSLGAPTSVSSSEIGTGSGYARTAMGMGAAGTPAGSGTATNTAAVTFGPFSTAQSITGIFLVDNVTTGSGTMLFFGNLATARTVSAGDSLVVASGALTITLAAWLCFLIVPLGSVLY